ncbi:hypothetical protein K432DRAFT_2383 [Lepidopterella palustris CBS 459.81]|uniref:Uncharacterized protein n=1 Tax=Lepidopterella palustris CBS 459.81 TaxID=1314670 RepID=A0A8E2EKX5_9PEZI|nr:hypothetical protein K432DRAFT_2383 [Lepidopterella palustris CBS 459.81]
MMEKEHGSSLLLAVLFPIFHKSWAATNEFADLPSSFTVNQEATEIGRASFKLRSLPFSPHLFFSTSLSITNITSLSTSSYSLSLLPASNTYLHPTQFQ